VSGEHEFADIRTLEAVVAWMAARGLRGDALAITTQDEFSHDAVVADCTRWIAFGVT
jgi:hypothetical protein